MCRAVEIRICPLLFQINFENRAFFNSNASSFEPSYSSTKISSRAIRRVSRPFHHVRRIIIIQLLGKRQIFHSIWNRLNTKGNTPACLIQGTKLKYKIRPRWTRFPLATHTCGGVRIALWINGVPPRMCPDIHLFVYLCKFCARSLFPFSLNKLGAGLAAQINYGLIN